MFYRGRKRMKNTLIVAMKNNSSMKDTTNSLLLCLLNSSSFPPIALFLSTTSTVWHYVYPHWLTITHTCTHTLKHFLSAFSSTRALIWVFLLHPVHSFRKLHRILKTSRQTLSSFNQDLKLTGMER